MEKNGTKGAPRGRKATRERQAARPRCLKIAERGVTTGADFAEMMSALMSDIIEQRIDPAVANATCNAGGKLLKIVEMQYRYGEKQVGGQKRVLNLVSLTTGVESELVQ